MSATSLCLDIGNSRIKIGLFEGQQLIQNFSIEDGDRWEPNSLNLVPTRGIFSSVRADKPPILNQLETCINFLQLDDTISLPIEVLYQKPETLGKDRLAAAVAAHHHFPNRDVLHIDCGTCTTYNITTKEGKYLGGNITPGVKMRLQAMHHFTGKLPLIYDTGEYIAFGDDTHSSILSGAWHGAVLEMQAWINHYKSRFNQLEIVLTGGAAPLFESRLKCEIFAKPFLVLEGLNQILIHNA